MTVARRGSQAGEATVVGVLIMPVLALALGAVLHVGLYLVARQATVTAVQQGLTVAAAADTSVEEGEQAARELIGRHSAAEVVNVATIAASTTMTMTATVRAPGLVPGLPRTLTISQTATLEQFQSP